MDIKSLFKKRSKTTHVKEVQQKYHANAEFGPYRDFKSEMDIAELEAAVQDAEAAPLYWRYPLNSIYKHALVDLHLQSQINNLTNEVIDEPFIIEDENGNPLPELTRHLEDSRWFYTYIKEYINTVYWGVTLLDLYPNLEGTDLQQIKVIDRLMVNPDRGLVHFNEYSQMDGIPYREEPFNYWLIEFNNTENPLGMLRSLSRETIWKYYSRKDWSIHSEGFGMPWVVGYMDGEGKRKNFVSEIANSGNQKISAVGQDDKVELQTDSRSNPQEMYTSQIDVCNKEISKGVTGNTESSESSTSSGYAQASVHENRLVSNASSRMRELKASINEVLLPFLREKLPGLTVPEGARFDYLQFIRQREIKYQPIPTAPTPVGQGKQAGQPVDPLEAPRLFSL